MQGSSCAIFLLFEPARLGTLRLPNRLVMAPLTRNRAGADGVPQPLMSTYYAQRASAGLIIFHDLRTSWPGTLIANPALGRGTPLPLPADGGLRAGERLLTAGADLIALGRAFLANPDLVECLRIGAPLNPLRDQHMMYVGGETGYTDYPVLAGVRHRVRPRGTCRTGSGGGAFVL
ncbi:oxidoreductase [Streptomyces mooreae]|uniref:oxidoreductase n=1 Tax=Streptomyces mooreae TaxID=3075523 RepID=UPI00374E0364